VWVSQTEEMWESVTSIRASTLHCFLQTHRPSFWSWVSDDLLHNEGTMTNTFWLDMFIFPELSWGPLTLLFSGCLGLFLRGWKDLDP